MISKPPKNAQSPQNDTAKSEAHDFDSNHAQDSKHAPDEQKKVQQKKSHPNQTHITQAALIAKNQRTGLMVLGVVVFMIGMSFASVPLYNLFCRVTGFGGTTQLAGQASQEAGFFSWFSSGSSSSGSNSSADGSGNSGLSGGGIIDPDAAGIPDHIIEDRIIKVNFNADTQRKLTWKFTPNQRNVKVHPGQQALIGYSAVNTGDKPITGTAMFNVTPPLAGQYFYKTQCFCFDRQTLNVGEEANFPVSFFIDPDIVNDPDLDDVQIITLSYTFFVADSQELEKAQKDF